MSKVKSKDTLIERQLGKLVFKSGYRYRKNVAMLPGKPDLVFRKYNAVVFINGCFWHGHINCKRSTLPKTRFNFWKTKIGENQTRDKKIAAILIDMGWRVAIVWECLFERSPMYVLRKLLGWLDSSKKTFKEIA